MIIFILKSSIIIIVDDNIDYGWERIWRKSSIISVCLIFHMYYLFSFPDSLPFSSSNNKLSKACSITEVKFCRYINSDFSISFIVFSSSRILDLHLHYTNLVLNVAVYNSYRHINVHRHLIRHIWQHAWYVGLFTYVRFSCN